MARSRLPPMLLLVVSLLLAGCTEAGDSPAAVADGDAANATPDASIVDDGEKRDDGTDEPQLDDLALLDARLARTPVNTTPGHNVTFVVSIGALTNAAGEAAGDAAAQVAVILEGSGSEIRGAAPAQLRIDGRTAVLIPLHVPADAPPGNVTLSLTLRSLEDGILLHSTADAGTLRVLDPERAVRTFQRDSVAQVLYTGRFADTGEVFNSNDPTLLGSGEFSRSADYRASSGVLGVQEGAVITGFYEGMLGMAPSESRRITIPAEQAYGPAWIEDTQARAVALERNYTLPLRDEEVTRDAFDAFLVESGQSNGTAPAAGDTFHLEQGGNRWTYVIESIDNDTVHYHLRLEVGEAYTLYPFAPNASVVTSVNATAALLRTTPTTELEEAFTYHAHWPGMSRVESVNETTLLVRHDPPEGFEYSLGPGGTVRSAADVHRVKSVDDEVIVIERGNGHPLAGRDLVFDVLLLDTASR